jgi:hypothetical protein
MKLVSVSSLACGVALVGVGALAAQACSSSGSSVIPDAGIIMMSSSTTSSSFASSGCQILGGCASSSPSTSSTGSSTGANPDGGFDSGTDASVDGGSGSGSSSGTGSGSSTGSGSGSGSGDAGGDAACHKPPTALHPETVPGVYCPFSGPDGGANVTCAAGKECCEPPSTGTSTCVLESTGCTAGDTEWQCDGPVDCAGGVSAANVCCGTGTIDTQIACGPYPAYPYVSDFKGTTCAASCNGGTFNGGTLSFIVCSQTSDCPAGTPTCTPIEPKGGGIGYCH